jgi:hypothetical protein
MKLFREKDSPKPPSKSSLLFSPFANPSIQGGVHSARLLLGIATFNYKLVARLVVFPRL